MSAFPWRIWKRMGCSWLRQGFKCFCKGRALIFFAVFEQICQFCVKIRFSLFWRNEKCPVFRQERRESPRNGKQRTFWSGHCPNKRLIAEKQNNTKRLGALNWHFLWCSPWATFHQSDAWVQSAGCQHNETVIVRSQQGAGWSLPPSKCMQPVRWLIAKK